MQDRLFTIKTFAQDPSSTKKRTDFVEMMLEDMNTQDFIKEVDSKLGLNVENFSEMQMPESDEELELHMQIGYKQAIELAHEQAIDNIFQTLKQV